MKKLGLLLIACFAFAAFASAQNNIVKSLERNVPGQGKVTIQRALDESHEPEVKKQLQIAEPTPEEKPKSTNMLPAILTLIVLACFWRVHSFSAAQRILAARK